MDESRSLIILVCVAAYFLLCIAVGIWAMRKTHSPRDFFMAGRDLGILVTGVAVFSSVMSGFGFVGGPEMVYRLGTSSFWIVISGVMGHVIGFFLLGQRLREMAVKHDAISIPDIVVARYDSRLAGLLTAVAILLGIMGYLASQILAMATVLQSLLAEIPAIGELSIVTCATASTALLVFYCVSGGIIASVYTDLVQGVIMVIAALLVFLTAYQSVDGGFAAMSTSIGSHDPAAIGPWGTAGMIHGLSLYFVFALGICGQPHVISKLMMTRRPEDARQTLPVTIFGAIVTALLWMSVGLAMRALVLQGIHPELESPNDTAPQFLQSYANPLLAGVVFAGLFAAIMSTADSFLNIGAAAVVHDIPRALIRRSVKHELFWARVATILIATAATAFALTSQALVSFLGVFGWGTFTAAIVPVVAIGLNWRRANGLSACVAIAASLLVNGILKIAFKGRIPFNIDAGAIALLTSMVLFIGVTLLTTRPGEESAGQPEQPRG